MSRLKLPLHRSAKKIARLYRAGQSITQLAAHWKISVAAVYRILVQLGVPRRSRGAVPGSTVAGKLGFQRREEMRADLRSGRFATLAEIARKYGVSRECVRLSAVAAGVTTYTLKARTEALLERKRLAREAREARKAAREAQRKPLAALWQSGARLSEIARVLGFTSAECASYWIRTWRALYPADFPISTERLPALERRERERARKALREQKTEAALAAKRARARALAIRRKARETRRTLQAKLWRIGASMEEIAEVFGITVGSAKTAIRRGRQRSPAEFPCRMPSKSRGRSNSRE